MRVLFAVFLLVAVTGLATVATAQDNTHTTIVMGAVDAPFSPCTPIPFDCTTTAPTIDVSGFTNAAVFVCLRNYEDIVGLQCAFQPPEGWTFMFGAWDCQVGQVNGTVPAPPFGERDGTITSAFNVVTGGALTTIGRLFFQPSVTGCLTIIESSYPEGTHVLAGDYSTIIHIDSGNVGSVCNGPGGYDACEFFNPVAPATWGKIKSQYQ